MNKQIFFSFGRIFILSAAVLSLGACATHQTTSSGAVGVERKQMMLLSSQEMNQAANTAYSDVLDEAEKKNQLNRNPAQVKRVQTVIDKLIEVVPVFRPDAAGWEWEVNVLTSEEVNAWCMPGGKIAVYTGIIEKLNLTDDELAAVMGHEISHALREHSRERASEELLKTTGLSVAGAVLGLKNNQMQLADMLGNLVISLPNSREHETEADRMGIELAARSGYDPRAAVTLWQKMAQQNQSWTPQFLSTHPSSETRIRDLQAYSEKVMPLYEQAVKTSGGKR